jgi:predicted nucleic acid-binding protein
VTPSLWRIEVANALTVALRRKRIDVAFREASLTDLAAHFVAIDPDSDRQVWSATVQLADQYRLTVYDAVYLELALRSRLPLATLDEALRAATQACSIDLLGVAT